MAVKRSQNWLNQQRVDTPHLRSIESAVRSDFDEMFAAFVLGESNSYVIRGFDIEMAGSIGASANGLQLIVEDSAILHGASNEAGTFFELPPGEDNQVLSATTNTRVEGAFTPGALNYVSIEFTRQVDDTTTDQLYLWNPTTQSEITKTLPLAETLDYKIVISSSLFTSNVLPLAIIETDASNNVLSIQDRRPMLFRLGTAGSATPDPFYEYAWDNHSEGRAENFWQSSNSTVSPFRGGDKQIRTFKENDEAIKTELKQIKGTTYWYSPNSAGSIAGLRYDLGNTIFTGRGYIEHNNGNPGQINWNEDMFLTVVSTRLKYKLEANAATTDIDLDDNQVAYVQLVRGIDVIPQLVFTNGADEVTSVGAIAWTTDLEAGDYVKIASESDTEYYQIASIDSPSQVTLTENFGGTSTGINGTDAKYAFGNYRTDAAPSTDRHIYVSNIEDVPFDADTYWLMLRSDSGGQARVYVRFLNAELEVGEQLQISDQVPAALLAYIGSANDSDADPEYATLATGVIASGPSLASTSNYNSVDGENLTVRASKLTSMMADKAQDKTIKILSDHTTVSNTENGVDSSLQDITFSGGSGTANIAMPSSANNGTIGLGSTLELAANQAAYFEVDRNGAFSLADLDSLTVSDLDSIALGENVFIFAYRLGTKTVYLWDGTVLPEGDSIALSVLRGYVQQNKTVKLVKGGTWSWDSVTGELTNSASAYVQVAGLAENVNEIAAQTIALANDGECAYVTLKRSAGASTLTVSVADIASVPQDDHTFIIARRTNDDVVVGTSSFALQNRDYLELDGAKAEIDRRLDQLKVNPAQPIGKRVTVSASDIVQLNGSTLSLEQRNLILSFDGAQIDFETGEVFEADGVTPLNGGANDFTPFSIGLNEYFFYSISLLPNSTNADNTISGQILVLPASGSDASLSSAPKAPFSTIGIKLASVYVQEDGNGVGDIENIGFANIRNLGVGGSGSGSGTGFVKVDYHDPISTSLPTGSTVTIDGQSGADGDRVLFTNLSTPSENNKVYVLSGVGSSISWEATLDFNLGVPENGDTVIILSGDGFREAIGKFNDTEWVFNDTVRYYSGADYWEQSSLKTSDISASTTDNIFEVTLAGSENLIIDYSILRGSTKETGIFIVTSDGTDVKYNRYATNIGDVGVNLFADENSGNLRFRYTSDSSGAGTIKYTVKRWSNAAGGPGGIPSYSGASGGSTSAAGVNTDIQYNSGGSLAGDSDFQWDSSDKSLKLSNLKIEVMGSPVTINDNQSTPSTLFSFNGANYKFVICEYSIERDNQVRLGTLKIFHNGTTAYIVEDYGDSGGPGIDDTEIPITVLYSGGTVFIRYTSSNTGNSGVFKYSLRKWL